MKAPQWLEDLPVALPPADRWQIGLRPLSLTVEEGPDGPWQPYLMLVVESGTGAVLGHRLLESDADPDLVMDLLLSTMGEPAMGTPRRPSRFHTDVPRILPTLKELGQQYGIEADLLPDLPELSYVINSFEEFINLKPGRYLETEGADAETVGEFFHAAAEFNRSKCWKRISDIEPITLIMEEREEARYAVVMGNGGIVRGLALYDDPEDLEELYEDDEVDPSELACTSVVFVNKEEVSEEQWEEMETSGWEVVSDDAVPLATRTDALGPPRVPAMDQLRQLTVALTIIPGFVAKLPRKMEKRHPIEPSPRPMTLGDREVRVWIGYGMFLFDEEALPDGDE